ncbi:type II toxin-antitoxin system HicA family toxin [Candidatus Obscuribacterales bacterium]|nr:type II toxin-antitoxin system HicA family toxin [Candidatus Obscuribacterales bacterium]
MRARELLKVLHDLKCTRVRQKGSHIRIRCGICNTTVPNHSGEELGIGLLKQSSKDLSPCLGEGWLSQ